MADIVIETWEQLQELYQTLDPISLQSILNQVQEQIDYKTKDVWGNLVTAIPPANLDSEELSEEQIGLKWYCEHCGPITVVSGNLSIVFDQFANFGDNNNDNLFEAEGTITLFEENEQVVVPDDTTPEDEPEPAAEGEPSLNATQSTVTIAPSLLESINLNDLLSLEQNIVTEQNEDNGMYWIQIVKHIKKYIDIYENHNIVLSNLEGEQISIDANADFGVIFSEGENPILNTTNLITVSLVDTTIPPEPEEPVLPPEEDSTENPGEDAEGIDNSETGGTSGSEDDSSDTNDESYIGDDNVVQPD